MADLADVLLTLAAFAALLGLVRLLDGDAPVTDPVPRGRHGSRAELSVAFPPRGRGRHPPY